MKKQYKKLIKTGYIPLIRHALSSVELPLQKKLSKKKSLKIAREVLAFERKLAKITVDRGDLRDPIKNYHMFTQQELFKLAPVLKDYFEARHRSADFWKHSPQLNTDTPTYFSGLSKLLESTPASTLRNYLQWQLTNSLASSLSDKDSEPYFIFYSKNLSGVQARTPRWERCYYSTSSHLSDIMGRAFVSVAFKGKSKDKAQAMIHMIEAAFGNTLNTLSWLDDKTRGKAKVKLGALVDMIGYPETWKTYAKAIISDDHFANLMAIDKVANERNLAKLGKPVDKTEWSMSPATVNAYYDPESNKIVFPAAILQPPFFSTDQPMSMNFGAIGIVMGHELTHGFDDQGRLYDKDGALKSWWKNSTSEKFNSRAQCVANQYSQFKLQGKPVMHLNGNLTLGENLADNGGAQNAYKAYAKWAAQQPGGMAGQKVGKYTGEQLFFYGFSQSWCTVQKTKSERQQAVTDVHSPAQFRVNGALANHPAFAKAFGCKAGSKMNPGPEKRCLVWSDN